MSQQIEERTDLEEYEVAKFMENAREKNKRNELVIIPLDILYKLTDEEIKEIEK